MNSEDEKGCLINSISIKVSVSREDQDRDSLFFSKITQTMSEVYTTFPLMSNLRIQIDSLFFKRQLGMISISCSSLTE
jgi:hypothetical protein